MRAWRIATRSAPVVAAAWAGVILCIGAMAAPSAFATLAPAEAGRLAARLFGQEAYLGLGAAVLLIGIDRHRAAVTAARPVFGTNLLLLLGTLFCTVAGHFALLPMMAAARAGHGAASFAVLHGVAGAFFAVKGVLVLALAWRLAAPVRPAAPTS